MNQRVYFFKKIRLRRSRIVSFLTIILVNVNDSYNNDSFTLD